MNTYFGRRGTRPRRGRADAAAEPPWTAPSADGSPLGPDKARDTNGVPGLAGATRYSMLTLSGLALSAMPVRGGGLLDQVVAPIRWGPAWVAAWEPPNGYGPCPQGGTQLLLKLDESGSVGDLDPVAFRHLLLARVMRTLAQACTCGECTVELQLFGLTPTVHAPKFPASSWAKAHAELAPSMERLPTTGSFLGPALDRPGASQPGPDTEVNVALTDLQIFDPDAGFQVQRFSAMANPLLVMLGQQSNVPYDPDKLPTVAVTAESDRTTIADEIAEHIRGSRLRNAPPPPPLLEPRIRRRRQGFGGKRSGSLAAMLLLLLLVLVGLAASHHSNATAGSIPGPVLPVVAAGSPTPNQPSDQPTVTDAGFALPPMTGTVKRTQPVRTVWVVDKSLAADGATLRQMRRELMAVLAYQQRYAITGDTLAFASARGSPGSLPPIGSQIENLQATATPSSVFVKPLLAQPASSSNRELIVIATNRPNAWLALASQAAIGSSASVLIIDTLTSGAVPTNLLGSGPWTLPAGGHTPGSIAKPFARAWVQAAGGTWNA